MNRASNLVPVFELISSAHTIKLSLICILQTTEAPTPLPTLPTHTPNSPLTLILLYSSHSFEQDDTSRNFPAPYQMKLNGAQTTVNSCTANYLFTRQLIFAVCSIGRRGLSHL